MSDSAWLRLKVVWRDTLGRFFCAVGTSAQDCPLHTRYIVAARAL